MGRAIAPGPRISSRDHRVGDLLLGNRWHNAEQREPREVRQGRWDRHVALLRIDPEAPEASQQHRDALNMATSEKSSRADGVRDLAHESESTRIAIAQLRSVGEAIQRGTRDPISAMGESPSAEAIAALTRARAAMARAGRRGRIREQFEIAAAIGLLSGAVIGIEQIAKNNLPACPTCNAAPGARCHNRAGDPVKPHERRRTLP